MSVLFLIAAILSIAAVDGDGPVVSLRSYSILAAFGGLIGVSVYEDFRAWRAR